MTRQTHWSWQTIIGPNSRSLMVGDQSCKGNRLIDLGQPLENDDAVTKIYVDTTIANATKPVMGDPAHFVIIGPNGKLEDGRCSPTDFQLVGKPRIYGDLIREHWDGEKTDFTIQPFIKDSEEVFYNKVIQVREIDYTPYPENGMIRMILPPYEDETVVVSYTPR